MKKIPCKCFAPASVANVAVGYDVLGFALEELGDEIIIREGKEKGLKIKTIRNRGKLSYDPLKNVAGFAALKMMEHLDIVDMPIEIDLNKNMPIGTGMGSSAASAVAGAFAVNAFLDWPCKMHEVLKCATMGEQLADGSWHADNVAPSLYGGFVLIRDNETLDVIGLPTIEGLRAVVIYPHVKVLTKDSRNILSNKVDLQSHIKQSGNLAAFVAAMYKSDIELLGRALEDIIIEPQRAALIPHFYQMKEAALSAGALGFSISGAGPSMFALCANSVIADNIEDAAKKLYKEEGKEVTVYNSKINLEGAKKY